MFENTKREVYGREYVKLEAAGNEGIISWLSAC